MFGPGAYGLGGFGHFIGAVVGGLLAFFLFLAGIALVFLLVRFLLVATRAAQIYVSKNSPAPAARPTTPGSGSAGPAYAPRPTTVTAPATTVAPTTPVVKPATKPRTPKPPTA